MRVVSFFAGAGGLDLGLQKRFIFKLSIIQSSLIMETIEFQKKQYRIREINLPKFGEVLISTTSLNDVLLKNGNYVSNEASTIDEQIFYFVNEREINFSDKKLINLITTEVL
ncbi:MAG TPA: hypothetical protein VIM07_15855 [Chitinophagaceae bacterium]